MNWLIMISMLQSNMFTIILVKKIHYEGHSQVFHGTLMAFVALPREKLLNVFRSATLFSPITYINLNPTKEISLVVGLFLTNVRHTNKITLYLTIILG
ncbi:hypothetical protein MtrunA17_Chr3g0120001 [Medicago truncatula]|uniref:Uncharacterized protein n=1 Tax=Medicago truncatula TaxID=3880 RepID=A0A396ITF7_MEDTR|nr:hypothetical protein MtrunA17_Chr3g0120001 [Medicago truncatula]